MNIRKAKEDDIDSICSLSNEINILHHEHMPEMFKYPSSLDQDATYWLKYMKDSDHVVFVAQRQGRVVGAISARLVLNNSAPFLVERLRCCINTIVVGNNQQKQGFGKALMNAVEAWGLERKAEVVDLDVMHFNTNARTFYEELGFEVVSYRMGKKL